MDVADERLTLSIPSNPRYLCILRAFCRSMLEALGFSHAEADKVTLAVHEACTNVIEHCYGGDMAQRIDITVFVTADDIAIEIRDYGQKQDVAAIKPRALHDVRPRGLGTHFMQSVMDDVSYHSSDTGTLVRMTKRRSVPCASP
jgi:anti-sigma regulatory factor (Ser/Thr protein kinase)